ncbi:ankyrin repeat-containing domain protein [Massariosphaeria phaeospora]|uniref:Ankyrin repeat-containing domain protein n=1 Tax=Massariosphaeria phaeospora TaxID=100035 RepID=A0A7C8I3Q4_9PLEO|nr:ankyrin repeat-containing domain protein [Massariosphaeria phaeospora]
MDPLSVAASIVAVLQLSAKVLAYLNDVKDASKDRAKCAIEVSNLHSLLLNLRFRLEEGTANTPWYTAIRALAVENGPLDQFKQALETLQTTMTGRGRLKMASDALVWKFKKEEVASILVRIERLKTLVEIALQTDHFKLSQAIKDDSSFVRTHVPVILSGVDEVRQDHDAARHRRLLEWISPTEYPAQQSDIIKRRQEGTCQWFLDAPEVAKWLSEAKGTLFCPGIPGAGKTMVAATAIDHLLKSAQNSSRGVAYVYCNYKVKAEQDASSMLAAILKQLVQCRPSAGEPAERLYKQHVNQGTKLSLDEVYSALRDVLARYSTVHIVVDALDECQKSDGTRMQFLTKIWDLQAERDVCLMATSRFIPEIMDAFREALQLEVRASNQDVKRFVAGKIDQLPRCIQRNPALQEMVQEKIVEAVDGMFLLARLHTDSLLDKRTAKDVKLTLAKLSRGSAALDNAYTDALHRIDGQLDGDRKLARKVLSWITLAKRPLTTPEICCALAVELHDTELDSENIPDVEDLVSVCAGLVVIDPESAIIRLVHYTAQEYFERISDTWALGARLHIATVCLTYLTFNAFESGICTTHEDFEERLQRNEFLDYAAKHWGDHAKAVEAKVLSTRTHQFGLYLQSFTLGTHLHYTAQFGLSQITRDLLSGIEQSSTSVVNATDNLGRTPLLLAAEYGHSETAKLLLDQGADIELHCEHYHNALCGASAEGHPEVVKLLLKAGAQVNAQSGQYGNALQAAAAKGNNQVLKLLLDAGAEINMECGYYGCALYAAIEEDYEDTVQLLVEKGANVTGLDAQLKGALHHAVNHTTCSPSMVILLLDHGAPMNTVDVDNMTPLYYSVKFSNKLVANLLLERGVQIDSGIYRKTWIRKTVGDNTIYEEFTLKSTPEVSHVSACLTPLHFASLIGNPAMTAFLLEYGADPNALSVHSESPLHLAIRKRLHGREYSDDWIDPNLRAEWLWDSADFEDDDIDTITTDIIQHRIGVLDALLSDPRTSLNVRDCEGACPLHYIQYSDLESAIVIQRLLSQGADPFCGNSMQQNALHLASRAGHYEAVISLLSLGVGPDITDEEGLNALHYAAQGGNHKTIAAVLESEKAKAVSLVASKDRRGMNALHHHLSRHSSRADTVQLLLAQGVEGSVLDESGASPLASYLQSGKLSINVDVCRLLLQIPGNTSFVSHDGQTLGHLCARSLDFGIHILNVMKEHSVDLTRGDLEGRTVLHRAAISGSLTNKALDFLINEVGLQPSTEDSYGKTALQYATELAARTRSRDSWDAGRWERTRKVLLQRSPASIA